MLVSPERPAYVCCRVPSVVPGGQVLPGHIASPGMASSRSLLARGCQRLLRLTIETLRLHVQVAYPVIIRTGGVPEGLDGFCVRRKSRFVIHLSEKLSPEASPHVAVHEFAHAAAWSHLHDRACRDVARGLITEAEFHDRVHDATFGIAFAQCWRVYVSSVLPEFERLSSGDTRYPGAA